MSELAKLKCSNAVMDGEIVMLDPEGRSRFQLLQKSGAQGRDSVLVYYVFDLMHLDGRALTGLPIEERFGRLVSLAGRLKATVQVSPAFDVEPSELFAAARRRGLEGIVAKRPGSPYEPDRRSGAWVKCKVLSEQEFVIGGFTQPRDSRQHFGALLVGYFEGRKFLYAGKVGTGFDEARLASLHAGFLRLRRKDCPFENLPSAARARFGTGMGPAQMRRVTWLKPVTVAQIKFAEWTDEGLLRQPVFLGMREDKPASDVHRNAAVPKKGRFPRSRAAG